MYQRNHIVVFLEDIYTPVERTLIEAGRHEDVRRTRQVFQDAMRERFSKSVEEITGRKVIQFMSQVSFDPDMAAEIFILEPGTTEDIALEEIRPGWKGRTLRPRVKSTKLRLAQADPSA